MKANQILLIVACLFLWRSISGQNNLDGKTCTDCHKDLISKNIVHAPAEESCDYCHESTNKEHPSKAVKGFKLAEKLPDLCFMCHEISPGNYSHMPFSEGSCMKCHNIHSSDNPSLLITAPTSNLCVDCHWRDLTETRYKHQPYLTGNCQGCHNPHRSDQRSLLKNSIPDLCYNCHKDIKADPNTKSIHPPAEDDCLGCHGFHGSNYKNLLNESLPSLCFNCHDEGIVNHEFGHSPVIEGKCASCHNSHQSDNQSLLNNSLPNLCFECHDDEKEEMNKSNLHAPFEDNCDNCHGVHGASNKALLSKDPTSLCFDCHDDVKIKMENDQLIHVAVNEKKKCMNCHSPHASDYEALANNEETKMCLTCHNKTINTATKQLKNMRQVLANSKFLHGAIEIGGCSVCHSSHSSSFPNLLESPYPSGPYVNAEEDNFNLCFECHDPEMLKEPLTTSSTNFRNNDQNLHYLHVMKGKGRNCNTCHDMHGSVYPHLIASNVNFGNWSMPMMYESNEFGGSCSTGCHSKKSYSRK